MRAIEFAIGKPTWVSLSLTLVWTSEGMWFSQIPTLGPPTHPVAPATVSRRLFTGVKFTRLDQAQAHQQEHDRSKRGQKGKSHLLKDGHTPGSLHFLSH